MPASASSGSQVSSAIGRFKILRLLGKGNQSEVYLAYDPHLEREVAIKTLQFASPAERAANMDNLLNEARTVSRLQHPHIVTLHDAGEHQGQPYLVFEWVDGPTLAQVLKQEGPVSAPRAAELAIQILDALGYAHAQGIIHRDIKPSNVLLGANGIARVMDFGIASRIDNQAAKSGFLMGTPAYMAPEYIANEDFGPQSDIFSFGVLMYELLTGRPAVRGKDVHDVMRRIVADPIAPPSKHNANIDEKLDDILLRALKKDPAERFDDAWLMKNAFELYLSPDAATLPIGPDGKQSTLEFLLRRMRLKSDFPALSEAVTAINRIAASDKESVSQLSNTILKDFALTNKLLRLVNAAYYGHIGGGSISTISRAVVILGFDAVRSIAVTLMLFDNLQNKGHAQQLKEEFIKLLYAGMLARGMAGKAQVKDAEEAFICSMFHNLGRMLSMFYFLEETEAIKNLIQTKGYTEEKASTRVLGLSFEDLGIGIAKSWGFPDPIVLSMKRLPDDRIKKCTNNTEKLRVLAGFSNELCEAIVGTPEADRSKVLAKLSARFGDSLPLGTTQLAALMEKSMQDISQFAAAVSVNLKQSPFAQQASKWAGASEPPPPAAKSAAATAKAVTHQTAIAATGMAQAAASEAVSALDAETQTALATSLLHEHAPVLDLALNADGSKPVLTTEEIQSILTSGLKDISNSLIDDTISVNDILHMILETMYSGMGFSHVVFCIKDSRQNTMCGKFGFGDEVQTLLQAFRFSMVDQPDVFHVALKNNADILINNIDDAKIATRIPHWYRQSVTARTFVIFPITVKAKPIGLIYADRLQPGDITIPEKELSLLKALRNQAILAIRQTL